MLFRFDWEQLISPTFVDRLLSLVSDGHEEDRQEVSALLSLVFRHTGGLPVAYNNWSTDHRNKVAQKLLQESITRLLKFRYNLRHYRKGYIKDTNDLIVAYPEVDINSSSKKELVDLPVIGEAIAKRIIDSRNLNGSFSSLEDLVERILGLGEKGKSELEGVLRCFPDHSPASFIISGDFVTDMDTALNLSGVKADPNPIHALLSKLVVFISSKPHPASRDSKKRPDLEPRDLEPIEPSLLADGLELLPDNSYYNKLLSFIEDADEKIDICMFFIALGGAQHPTRRILEKLVEKSKAGVEVRVLLDKDSEDDPYGSRIINSEAAKYLVGEGVSVRTDQTERLLHSKFVLIDGHKTIIGSHNWTAGSYFTYKDISIVLAGTSVAATWEERFETLWAAGVVF